MNVPLHFHCDVLPHLSDASFLQCLQEDAKTDDAVTEERLIETIGREEERLQQQQARATRSEYNRKLGLHCEISKQDYWPRFAQEVNISDLMDLPAKETHGLAKEITVKEEQEFARMKQKALFDGTSRGRDLTWLGLY